MEINNAAIVLMTAFFGALHPPLSAADVACVIYLEEVVRDCDVVAGRLAAAACHSLAALAVLVEAEEGGEPPNQHETDRPEDHWRDVVAGAAERGYEVKLL